jgi:hypothetical protein
MQTIEAKHSTLDFQNFGKTLEENEIMSFPFFEVSENILFSNFDDDFSIFM